MKGSASFIFLRNTSLGTVKDGVVIGLLNPGLVDTRGLTKLGPDDPVPNDFAQIVKLIRSGAIELISPEESVAGMIKLIESLTSEQSGDFLNYDGESMPW